MATGMHQDPLQNPTPPPARASAQAREQAAEVWEDAKQAAHSTLSEQQQAAAGGLGDFAHALRRAAREMEGGRDGTVARFAESAAEGLERFSGTLRRKDLNGVMSDMESFARQQPVAFFGAAMFAGFLAVRFLKSSPRDQSAGSRTGQRAGDSTAQNFPTEL